MVHKVAICLFIQLYVSNFTLFIYLFVIVSKKVPPNKFTV